MKATINDMVAQLVSDSAMRIYDHIVVIEDGQCTTVVSREEHDDTIESLSDREWDSVEAAYSEGYCGSTTPLLCSLAGNYNNELTPEIEALAGDLDEALPEWREIFEVK